MVVGGGGKLLLWEKSKRTKVHIVGSKAPSSRQTDWGLLKRYYYYATLPTTRSELFVSSKQDIAPRHSFLQFILHIGSGALGPYMQHSSFAFLSAWDELHQANCTVWTVCTHLGYVYIKPEQIQFCKDLRKSSVKQAHGCKSSTTSIRHKFTSHIIWLSDYLLSRMHPNQTSKLYRTVQF